MSTRTRAYAFNLQVSKHCVETIPHQPDVIKIDPTPKQDSPYQADFDRLTQSQMERAKLADIPEIKGVRLKGSKLPVEVQEVGRALIDYIENQADESPYLWVRHAEIMNECINGGEIGKAALLSILNSAIPLKHGMRLENFSPSEFSYKYLHFQPSLLEQAETELVSPQDVKHVEMESAPIDLPVPVFLPTEDETEERTYQLTAGQVEDLVLGKLALINGELAETDVGSYRYGSDPAVFDYAPKPTDGEIEALLFGTEQMKLADVKLSDLVADANIARLYDKTESVEPGALVASARPAVELAYEEFLSEVKRLGIDVDLRGLALYVQDRYWSSLRGRVIDALRLMLIMHSETELYLALEKEFGVKPYTILAQGKRT